MHGANLLARYESARTALAECHRVDEVKVIHDKAMALQLYAKQAKDTELIEYATEIRLRAERRAGELLKAAEKNKGGWNQRNKHESCGDATEPQDDAPTLAEMGINKKQSSEWQKFADLSASAFEAKVVRAKAKASKASSSVDEFRGLKDEWHTPPEYIEAVRDVFGGRIDLDPASCPEAQKTVRAQRYYTKDDDGLNQKWRGRVFLNPPYSDPTPFIDKLIKGYEAGVVSEAILLENTDASSKWFHRAMRVCSAMCFASTRIKFKSGVNGKEGAPRYSSLFFYFGSDVEKFARHFSAIGSICIPYRQD